jgi:hypothetical protein
MTSKPDLYFGASDRQMEGFVDLSAFKEALVYGLLFQGNLVVPDIFIYISSHIGSLLLSDNLAQNFIAHGFRSSAIIPAFRSETGESFRQNLTEIRTAGIQGLHPDADKIAETLDSGLGDRHLYRRTWPKEALSVGYRKILESYLFNKDAPEKFPDLADIWKDSLDFRTAIVEGVVPDGLGGFRRGDIYNALHKSINKSADAVQDIRDIWSPIKDPNKLHSVERILKWVNYCYSYNQGRMFSLKPNLSALDEIDMQFTSYLAGLQASTDAADLLSEEFRLPSASAILTIDPPYLFDIRDSDVGGTYFSSINAWRAEPTEEHAQLLLESLRTYTSAIRRAYFAKGKSMLNWEWHMKAHIPCGKTAWGEVGRGALGAIASEGAGAIVPHIGLISVVGRAAAAMYETLPASWRDKIAPGMGVDTRVRIDYRGKVSHLKTGESTSREASFQ